MLLYRAQLADGAATVLSAAVRPAPARPRLGDGGGALFRVTVRYVVTGGRLATHRGWLRAAVPAGRGLAVAGSHLSGTELFLTLGPGAPPERTGVGAALGDRFRLPLRLQAWGVTAVQGAGIDLQVLCRSGGGALLVRGVLGLLLETPGSAVPLRLRVPFCRTLAADGGEDLRWRALAGVTGLYLKVEPGGRIEGEAVVALRCEGRPPGPGPARGLTAGGADFARLRELSGRILRAAAEPAGAGHALVQGLAELDLYWFDREGRSRWTGRQVPFSALVEVEGTAPGDRLEAAATLERLHHRAPPEGSGGGPVVAHLVISTSVTALRSRVLEMGGARYRLEQVVGSAAAAVEAEARFFPPEEGADTGGGFQVVPATLPLAGPAAGWQEVATVLSTPEAERDAGRWRVRAALGGTPAGEPPYPAPLKAMASGSGPDGLSGVLTVIAGLTRVDPTGIRIRTALAWGPPLPAADGGGPGDRALAGAADLPGPVRSVIAVEAEGRGPVRVRALVALAPRGLALVEGVLELPEPEQPGLGRPVRLLAWPSQNGGKWQLQMSVDLAARNP
jgi:hypothetical protein